MESKHDPDMIDSLTCMFYEFLGTMILCFAVTTVSAYGGDVFFIPLGLYIAIQYGGKITGGHFNPAVSVAIFVGRKNFARILSLVFYLVG